MSANNCTLIKRYKGRWYIFSNVLAESWEDTKGRVNELSLKEAEAVCDTLEEAYEKAKEIDAKEGQFDEGTEYGVQVDRLVKDQAEVIIKE